MAVYTTCRKHPCSAWHADLVEGYRLAVEAQYLAAEAATGGYATELADYWSDRGGRLTFKEWLLAHRQREDEEA